MSFLERFIPKSKKIEKDNTSNASVENLQSVGAKKELSIEDINEDLKESLKIKEIITGENPSEPNEEEANMIEKSFSDNVDEVEVAKNNIDIWNKNIERNLDKIKQYELSIERAEEEAVNSNSPEVTLSVEKLSRMRDSLIRQNEEMKKEIESEKLKIETRSNDFFNLN